MESDPITRSRSVPPGPPSLDPPEAGDGSSWFEAPGVAPRGGPGHPYDGDDSWFVAAPIEAIAPGLPHDAPSEELVSRLVAEMVDELSEEGVSRIEEVRDRYPALPEPALRLIADGIRSRGQGLWGAEEPSDEIVDASLTPETRPTVPAGDDDHRPRPGLASAPGVGEMIGDFRLMACLGRGTRGAVFLAEQPTLAHRPVVLKVTPRDGLEHLSLARLRHPHIVPLYCVQEVPRRDMRLLCMPYLGGATLSRILKELEGIPVGRRSGRDLLRVLDQAADEAPLPVPRLGPSRPLLANASYLQATCWIGACLADALASAHRRGLVHLDLKPSNVLMAADGTPMLLDFHLAGPPLRPGELGPRGIGGTPPYMSPELRRAVSDHQEGRPISVAIDGRSDIYALGLVLYQMLGGSLMIGPYPRDPVVYRRPAGVPSGLSRILARCLADDPDGRYPDGARLAEDLRRQLSGEESRGAPGLLRRLRRRAPGGGGTLQAVVLAGVAVAMGGFIAEADARHRLRNADALLATGRAEIERGDIGAAEVALAQGLALLDGGWSLALERPPSRVPGLRQDLTGLLGRARRERMADRVHATADRLRALYGTDLPMSARLDTLVHQLGRIWESRDRLLAQLDGPMDTGRSGRLRTDLLDLGILWADLRVRSATAGGADEASARREALRVLDEAGRLFGDSAVLAREHRRHAEALGMDEPPRGNIPAPRDAWEHYAVGRSLMAAGDLEGAARSFDRATELRPQDLWAQLSRGLCAYRRGRYDDALAAFEACVALSPGTAACYHNRALAHAALGHDELARRDRDHARRLEIEADAAPRDPDGPE